MVVIKIWMLHKYIYIYVYIKYEVYMLRSSIVQFGLFHDLVKFGQFLGSLLISLDVKLTDIFVVFPGPDEGAAFVSGKKSRKSCIYAYAAWNQYLNIETDMQEDQHTVIKNISMFTLNYSQIEHVNSKT